MKTMYRLAMLGLVCALAACSTSQIQTGSILASDGCILGLAAFQADPKLQTHNVAAATVANKACALAPAILGSLVPLNAVTASVATVPPANAATATVPVAAP